MKYFVTVVAIISIVILGVVGLGWLGGAANVASFRNVSEQYAESYKNYEALKATAINLCSAEQALAITTDPSERSQRITQVSAHEQNYARIAALYDAAMADAFRAKFVKPADLPDRAPTLAQSRAGAGC